MDETIDISNFEHKCCECDRVYASSTNLYEHIRRKHAAGKTVAFNPSKSLMKCPLCDTECISRQKMELHFQSDHEIELHKESWEFSSKTEFKEWKSAMEGEYNTFFVQKSGSKLTKGIKTTYYYCYRSGIFISKGTGQRRLKAEGSTKIGAFCPSMLKVMEHGTKFVVDYIATHLGHTDESDF